MEEMIFTYLIEKGGALGILLAISLSWIVFRERMILGGGKGKEESVGKNVELEKMLYKNLQNSLDNLNDKVSDIESKIEDIERKTHDLWEWHNVKDSDGIPRWYVKRSLEQSIDKLETSIIELRTQTTESLKLLDNVTDSKMELTNRLQQVNDSRIEELKTIIENYNKTMNDLSMALEKIKYALKVSKNGVSDD